MAAPSGHQYTLVGPNDQRSVVVEVGGGLREYTLGGEAVLDGYGEAETAAGGRGQILVPWPNRVGDGRFTFDGEAFQLPLTETDLNNAIHGLTRWSTWSLTEATTHSVRLKNRVHPQPGWSWPLEVEVGYSLTDTGLVVDLGATNVGAVPCPWGAGFHPYLAAFGGPADDVDLRVPAGTRYLADERGLPTGTEAVAGTEFDFRSGRRVGAQLLDTAYTDLLRGPDGLARVELSRGDRRTELWVDGSWSHLMVFTGDTLGNVSRRRRGLAVEPMTAPPDMLRSGVGCIVLAPGERWSGSWGITPGAVL